MKFEKMGVYRHKSCLDIDIVILRSISDIRFYVSYFNRHYRIFQGESEYVNIRAEDRLNWTEVK